ncbi:AAWKG family protein [Streptomyces sp. NPDC006798]|uniref:AAWKG family protein n=1 Tax=Streptomyces sp. NPDC006798 TaxID=3155462 RepID=UPI0033D54D00
MAANVLWEDIVRPLTGFDGGKREDVGKAGGTSDSGGNGGRGWLKADIQHKSLSAMGENTQKDFGPGTKRVIQFYQDPGGGSITSYYEVTLSLASDMDTNNDFSPDGVVNRFIEGYGAALGALVNKGTANGYQFDSKEGVADSPDLNSLVANAKSFDAVLKYFEAKEPVLAGWLKDLGDGDAAWRGTSADAFRELIDGVHLGYKNLATVLAAGTGAPPTTMPYVTPAYTPVSGPGKTLVQAANAVHDLADNLHQRWTAWKADATMAHHPAGHLDHWLDVVAKYLDENNIAKTTGGTRMVSVAAGSSFVWRTEGVREATAGFSIYHPEFGDLRTEEAWREIGRRSYDSWTGAKAAEGGPVGLNILDDFAGPLATTLNNSLAGFARANSSFAFNAGFTDLRARFTQREGERKAAEAEKEAQRQKEEMEKKLGGGGGDGQIPPPPGLGPNGPGGKDGNLGIGGPGGKDGNLGVGGPGAPKPPPGLDLNGPGPGTGGPGGLKPPPGSDLGGPGGGDKNVIRNPDGSVSVRNPDGSYTTTRPDGSKVITPPGVLPPGALPPGLGPNQPPPGTGIKPPPGLGPNQPPPGTPGTGTPSPPLKTVKGPDGSTTAYNQDGSRTTTHKDGATTTVGRDGTVTTTNPGGSTTVLNKDGSQSVTYADGSKTTYKSDGSSVTQYKNGAIVQRAADGTVTTIDAEGNKKVGHPAPGETVRNPDGSTTTYDKGGSTTTVHPDGTRTTVGADGTVTTLDPDGTKTVSRLGQNSSTIEYADGSVAKVETDGTVVTTYKDGASTRLGPDGTYTVTDADGKKTTEHLNPLGGKAGATTTHNADGSTTTRYPDGTLDQEYKDGRRKVSYPDGRVITTDADGRTVSVTGGKQAPPPPGLGSSGYGKFGDGDLSNNRWSPPKSYGSSGGGQQPPALSLNSTGNSLVPPPPTAAGATGGDGGRSAAANDTGAAKGRPGPEDASRRPPTSSGMMPPMMPPMGGMGGMGGGQGGQNDERERQTWISEDEEVWGTDEGGVAGVIGR